MATRTEKIARILKNLYSNTPDVDGSALVSIDGLPIASSLPADIEEDSLAAMTAAILSLGERATEELDRGSLEQVMVKGDNGYIILIGVGIEAVLCVTAGSRAKLGMIFLDIKRAAKELTSIL